MRADYLHYRGDPSNSPFAVSKRCSIPMKLLINATNGHSSVRTVWLVFEESLMANTFDYCLLILLGGIVHVRVTRNNKTYFVSEDSNSRYLAALVVYYIIIEASIARPLLVNFFPVVPSFSFVKGEEEQIATLDRVSWPLRAITVASHVMLKY